MIRRWENVDKVMAALGTVALVLAIITLIIWRSAPTVIVIEDRWWTAWTSVQYDVMSTELVPVTETTCTGFGENRNCTTSTQLETRITTTTHTRCTVSAHERELPIVYPEPGCTMQPGDYRSGRHDSRVAYHLEEHSGTRDRPFKDELWNELEPGTVVAVRWNAMGMIMEVLP